MENKLYEGWEIAKILTECELEKGTKLKDNLGNEYKVVMIGAYAFLKGKYGECKAHILTNPDRKFYFVKED